MLTFVWYDKYEHGQSLRKYMAEHLWIENGWNKIVQLFAQSTLHENKNNTISVL